jgi:hypothetical protein
LQPGRTEFAENKLCWALAVVITSANKATHRIGFRIGSSPFRNTASVNPNWVARQHGAAAPLPHRRADAAAVSAIASGALVRGTAIPMRLRFCGIGVIQLTL